MRIGALMLPQPVLARHGGHWVVRDDLLPGGTKMRALLPLMMASAAPEFVYAGPAQGYAQLALAHCARLLGRRATLFVARRRQPHAMTLASQAAGAQVMHVPHGRLNVVQARARAYTDKTAGAYLLPFGLDLEPCLDAIAQAAAGLPIQPREVWTVAGSGVLTRALQRAWPLARFHADIVGRASANIGQAVRWCHELPFDSPARVLPPFPSARNYDAKGWEIMQREGAPEGALFWNVGG